MSLNLGPQSSVELPFDVLTLVLKECDDATTATLARLSFAFLGLASKQLYRDVVITSEAQLKLLFCDRVSLRRAAPLLGKGGLFAERDSFLVQDVSTPRVNRALSLHQISSLTLSLPSWLDRSPIDPSRWQARFLGHALHLDRLVIRFHPALPTLVPIVRVMGSTNPATAIFEDAEDAAPALPARIVLFPDSLGPLEMLFGTWDRLANLCLDRVWPVIASFHGLGRPPSLKKSLFAELPQSSSRAISVRLRLRSMTPAAGPPSLRRFFVSPSFTSLVCRPDVNFTMWAESVAEQGLVRLAWRETDLGRALGGGVVKTGPSRWTDAGLVEGTSDSVRTRCLRRFCVMCLLTVRSSVQLPTEDIAFGPTESLDPTTV